ncbi:winged helix-turn-helix domain-containing protein [Halorussus halophilus]|uniref:winged helix-turn-helix domain-containing protein n=1 Tax=Halorussus halophilus TaxID=2650975 RepID=UPI001300F77E|nr:helix-turn-helix domain-containing protein [Halorussus halophilus]
MNSTPGPSEAHRSPDEAFALLGNELRVEILRTLGAAEQPEDTHRDTHGRSFSELYEQVDAPNTSQFSYHLSQLEDVFVWQADDGYRLTHAGQKVVRAIFAGTYNERPEFEPVELDGVCPVCEATTFVVAHEQELLTIRCDECETRLLSYQLAPGQTENRTPEEVVESAQRHVRDEFSMAVEGVCFECSGRMHSQVQPGKEPLPNVFLEVATCERCGHKLTAPIAARVTYHPAVISFCWERGVDVTNEAFWGLFTRFHVDCWETECLSTDPYRFRVTVSLDGDELRTELDADLEIDAIETVESHSVEASAFESAPDASQS